MKGRMALTAGCMIAITIASPIHAQAPTPPAAQVPGWSDFLEGLRDLPHQILIRLPAEQRDDPQLRQEAARLALSAVAAATIDALASDPDHPVFVPQINNYLTIGQPNADTNYRSAKIAPGGIYRMRGNRGTMTMVRIVQAGPPDGQKAGGVTLGGSRKVFDLNSLTVDANGRYDVILSPTRPAGHHGDWWKLEPNTNMLLVRMVSGDWAKEIEPTLSIERLDRPAPRPRPSLKTLQDNLRAVPRTATTMGPLLVDRVQTLRDAGAINKLRAADLSESGGLTGQFYYEGAYELDDDEALILEARVPERCTYWSLILTNDLHETIDWYNNHSSLNFKQAKVDGDGVLRVVVSGRDPGVPNWLDTAGFARGAIQGRWTECAAQPVPIVQKVKVADVRKVLPATTPTITPEERDRILRDRRAQLQQRPLW